MALVYRFLFPALWLSWAFYWWLPVTAFKVIERRQPQGTRILHTLLLVLAACLLWADSVPLWFLNARFFRWAPWEFWAAVLTTALGLAFTVWARVHLAGNWSGTVTIKQGHELIVTGPYAHVRHPIYTGLLVAFTGTAMARGEWRGALAVLIVWLALWHKYRMEERWMVERFGEVYSAYLRKVPALLPWLTRRRS